MGHGFASEPGTRVQADKRAGSRSGSSPWVGAGDRWPYRGLMIWRRVWPSPSLTLTIHARRHGTPSVRCRSADGRPLEQRPARRVPSSGRCSRPARWSSPGSRALDRCGRQRAMSASKSTVHKGAAGPGTQARLSASKSALRVAARVSTACNTALTHHTSLSFHGTHARLGALRAPSRAALNRLSLRYPYAGCSESP